MDSPVRLFGALVYDAVSRTHGGMLDVMTGDDFASMFVKIAGLCWLAAPQFRCSVRISRRRSAMP